MSLTNEIKEYALSLGFCSAGITTTDNFDQIVEEMDARADKYEYWRERFTRGACPQKLWPGGKSIIVLAYDYAQTSFPESLLPFVGRAYLSRCYLPQSDSISYARLQLFENFLKQKDCAFMPDLNLLMLRPAAARAGVASFGRNNFSYVDGIGSFVILYGYMVDKELEYDAPLTECQCPPGCNACVSACPTKALYAPFKLDPTKCIGFNNWMRREGRFDPIIPRELRADIGLHIHGCDVCQEVCPRNKAKIASKYPKDRFLELIAERFSLVDLLHMPNGFYESVVHPIMYNYLEDKKYFQRNAAVAMGNSKNKEYIPDLARELGNCNELVRSHVAWALGAMDDSRAQLALRHHMPHETSEVVLKEIRAALHG